MLGKGFWPKPLADPVQTTIANLGGCYEHAACWLTLDLWSAFNSKDADITHCYASRLADEPERADDKGSKNRRLGGITAQ